MRAKPLRNAFLSTASLVETLGEIKMERLGEASACISKVDVFKRDSEKCKLEGSDVFSFMFVFAETMWMTVTNSNINKLVGLWQKRRFFFFRGMAAINDTVTRLAFFFDMHLAGLHTIS